MRICIHRGTHQIGGTCVELESSGRRILIDLGLPLDAESNDAVYLPDIPGLQNKDDSLLAVIISHPHLDHYGLLKHIDSGIPVYMGKDGRRIIEMASQFLPEAYSPRTGDMSYESNMAFTLGPFTITPYPVDHSAYDAYAFLIEADGKKVFYSGDIRMHGRKGKLMEKLMRKPPSGIDMLLLEGTTVGRSSHAEPLLSENDIESALAESFTRTPGMVLLHTSAQNIDRIVSIYRACIKSGRTLVIDLYTAVVLEATGNKHIPQSHWPRIQIYIPQAQRLQIKNNGWFDLLKHHSGDKRIYIEDLAEAAGKSVLIFRPIHMRDLEKAECLERALYIYSMWEGYWESPSNSRLKAWIERHSIEKENIHTSGHASTTDLKRFAEALKPAHIVPLHTFTPERYKDLFDNVEYLKDGEYREV